MTESSRWLVRTAAAGIALTMMNMGGAAAARGTVSGPLPASNQPPVTIEVNLNQADGPFKPIYSWFGYDEANYTTMRHGRELLKQLHDLSPVPVYIRVHHL